MFSRKAVPNAIHVGILNVDSYEISKLDKTYEMCYYRFMTKIISAGDARDQFSEMLSLATYSGADVVITRYDEPEAVLIGYKEWKKLKNDQTPSFVRNSGKKLFGLTKLGLKVPKGLDLSINYKKYLFDE